MVGKIALKLILLSMFYGVCSALSCHICDSADELGTDYCGMVTAGVDSTAVTGNVSYTDATCDKYCIKTEVTLGPKFKDNPDYLQSVSRTCGSQCIDHCYPITNPATYVQHEVCVNCCETDLCNGAGAVNFNLLTFACVVLSSFVLCEREMS